MEPFIGEIRLFAGNFPPKDWALCDGQLLSIAQYTALFSILRTNYGGDGKSTFGLPNLQGRVAIHQGQGPGLTARTLGERGGEAEVTLNEPQLPSHTHAAHCASSTSQASPEGAVWANSTGRGVRPYAPTPNSTMNPAALRPVGGGAPHNNLQPYVGLNYIIALNGVYPNRS